MLTTPVSRAELLVGKAAAVFMPAVALGYLMFGVFVAVTQLAGGRRRAAHSAAAGRAASAGRCERDQNAAVDLARSRCAFRYGTPWRAGHLRG